MRTQSNFKKLVDLKWYSAALQMLDLENRFNFSLPELDGSISAADIFDALDNPSELSKEKQHAIALAVSGTVCETDSIRSLTCNAVEQHDVCLAIANCLLNDEENRNEETMLWLARCEDFTLEECIIAMHAFTIEQSNRTIALISRIVDGIKGNVEFFIGNANAVWWLLEYNMKSYVKSEFLTCFRNAIWNVPDSGSSCYKKLWMYNFNALDAAIVIWWLRKTVSRFERKTVGNDAAVALVQKELAQHYRAWSCLELEVLQELGGSLNQRIELMKNYEKYYELYGFRLPELSMSFAYEDGVKMRLPLLSDKERCQIAMTAELTKEMAGILDLKFEEWSEELDEYYEKQGFSQAINKCYGLHNRKLLKLKSNAQVLAKIKIMDEFTPEEAAFAVGFVKKYSMYQFVRIIDACDCVEALGEGDKDIYFDLQYCVSADCDFTIDDFLDGSYKYAKYDRLFKAAKQGYEISRVFYSTQLSELNEMLEFVPDGELTEVLNKIKDSGCSIYQLVGMYRDTRDIAACLIALNDTSVEHDCETENVLILAQGLAYKSLREWAELSMIDCYRRLELSYEVLTTVKNATEYQDDRYKMCMASVIQQWIKTGSPMEEFMCKFPLSRNGVYQDDWIADWVRNVNKNSSDASSFGRMVGTEGVIDNSMVFLTDIGVITEDEGVVCGDIPVWVVADEGDADAIQRSVFLSGGPAPYRFCQVCIPCDTVLDLWLRRVR